jgi:uncharacterized protein (TIGR03545 family)
MSSGGKGRVIVTVSLAFVGMLVLLYMLFANQVIKSVLETKLGESYGAEVNIAEFSHSLFPTTATLKGIALTNASKPSRNQVLVGDAFADLELIPLFRQQVVINNVNLLNVEFDTKRATPGEVYRVPKPSITLEGIKNKAKEAVPSVDELLARNPLKTSAAIEQAKSVYDNYKSSLEKAFKTLPDKARVEDYKEKVEALKSTDLKKPQALLQAKTAFDAIKQDILADKALIDRFTEQASDAKQALSQSITALRKAPQQDYALLKGLIAGDQEALSRATYFVFGDKAEEYSGYLLSAMEIVVPLIQGMDENKDENQSSTTIPPILVKEANVSVLWKEESITSQWKNMTNVHEVFGQPTTFSIEAAGDLLKTFTSSGEFWIDENGVDASQNWQLAGINLSDVSLSENETLNAVLESALMKTAGSISVTDNILTGGGEIDLQKLVMQAAGSDEITQVISEALQALSSLTMTMLFDGTLSTPRFNLRSDLDKQLAQAALTQLTASQQGKLNEIQSKLNSMISKEQTLLNTELFDVNTMLSAARGENDVFDELLKTQLTDLIQQKKNRLFDKLIDKLGASLPQPNE